MAKPTGSPSPTRSEPLIRRKNLKIDQEKLDRVREFLCVSSDSEAVDQALSMLLLREDLIDGIERIAETGSVENVF